MVNIRGPPLTSSARDENLDLDGKSKLSKDGKLGLDYLIGLNISTKLTKLKVHVW